MLPPEVAVTFVANCISEKTPLGTFSDSHCTFFRQWKGDYLSDASENVDASSYRISLGKASIIGQDQVSWTGWLKNIGRLQVIRQLFFDVLGPFSGCELVLLSTL